MVSTFPPFPRLIVETLVTSLEYGRHTSKYIYNNMKITTSLTNTYKIDEPVADLEKLQAVQAMLADILTEILLF